MYSIESDLQNNILVLKFQGHFNSDDGKELYLALIRDIEKFSKGFKLLTDLSQLERMDFEACSTIDKIMELCNQHGVSKIIRVITHDEVDIGFNIMSLFHYSHSVIIHNCKSLQEAEMALLDHL